MVNFMLYLYNHNWAWTKQKSTVLSISQFLCVRYQKWLSWMVSDEWLCNFCQVQSFKGSWWFICMKTHSLTKLLAGGLGSSLCGPIPRAAWCLHNIIVNTTPHSEWPQRECEEEAMMPFLNLRSDVFLFLPDFVY